MQYNFIVRNDRLMLATEDRGCTNNVNMYVCNFKFLTDDWNELNPFVTFKIGAQYYTQRINNNQCVLPAVDKAQAIYVGVYGISSDSTEQKRMPTNWVVMNISEGAYIPGATVPPDPPEALWDEYSAKVEETAAALLEKADKTELTDKQDKLTFDTVPTEDSINPVTSGGIFYMQMDLEAAIGSKYNDILDKLDEKRNITDGAVITDIIRNDYEVSEPSLGYMNEIITTDGGTDFLTSAEVTRKLHKRVLNYIDSLKSKSIPHTTASGYPITLTDHLVNEDLLSCKVYGASSGVGDLVASGEYARKYAIPVVNRGKNLMELPKFGNASGITVSYQDGVYHIVPNESGTASVININNTIKLKAGETVTISCKINHKGNRVNSLRVYSVDLQPSSIGYIGNAGKNPQVVPSTELTKYSYKYTAPKDMTLNFQIFIHGFIDEDGDGINDRYPVDFADFQIEYGTVATDYEPYVTPSEATAYLDSPLITGQVTEVQGVKALDSEINRISVSTAVTPSKLEVCYYQDINKVLEEIKNAVLSQGGNV